MGITEILASIDRDIARLKQARALLVDDSSRESGKAAAKSNKTAVKVAPSTKGKKRVLTPEGRKRIAEAQKKRWEAQKKATAGQK